MSVHLTLMHREALRRLEDREALAGRGDSAHFLCLLGFELLLNLVHEVALGKETPHRNKYGLIFRDLPPAIQEKLLTVACERIGPSALNGDPAGVLKEWGKNFIDLSYPYEKYKGLTEDEYLNLGKRWVEAGAPSEHAQFRYFPEELFAMFEALKQVADNMATNSFQWTPVGVVDPER